MPFDRHRVLADFLRTRRARLSPEAVGLPPVQRRRRAPGLLREEVAFLANVSPAWYTRLERGHRAYPSTEVLQSVADALKLTVTERRYLVAVGAEQPPHAWQETTPAAETAAALRLLVSHHDDADLPVLAIDGEFQLLAWNPATTTWYADFGRRNGFERNLLWWLFTDQRARRLLRNWEVCATGIVAMARFTLGARHLDPADVEVVAKLCADHPDFVRRWDTHDVTEPEITTAVFRHPGRGVRTLRLVPMRLGPEGGAWLVHHLDA